LRADVELAIGLPLDFETIYEAFDSIRSLVSEFEADSRKPRSDRDD